MLLLEKCEIEIKRVCAFAFSQSMGRSGPSVVSSGTLYAHNCDITKSEDIMRVLRWTRARLGGVDILINNAQAHKGKS